ncbi:hypothetical protein [Actinospica robiniae]|uniref:hypothetical protein n=1 Tax=Actinospica robiniae TaxID=304901 RepID=UPI000401CFF2|nr:hypothetical protein [Actinospica robiniae]
MAEHEAADGGGVAELDAGVAAGIGAEAAVGTAAAAVISAGGAGIDVAAAAVDEAVAVVADTLLPNRPTLLGEFARIARTRPDWFYGMLCSWGIGYAFLAYLVLFTHPNLKGDPTTVVVLVVLTAIADGSLTNQLAAEPEWSAALLRSGEDPARILRVRNLMLLLCELVYVASVVALIAWLGHTDAWIPRALPQLAVMPLAPIAIGNLSSVLAPAPFMRLNRRFQAPGTWVRWAVYVTIPLMLSTYSLALYWLPTRVEHHFEPKLLKRVGALKHLTITQASATHVYIAIWLVLIPLWQLAVWLFALRLADALARMRRHGLARLMDRHVELAGALPQLSLYQSVRALPVRCREIPTDLRAELKLIRSELLEASTTLSRL